jgi:hypothetical protein
VATDVDGGRGGVAPPGQVVVPVVLMRRMNWHLDQMVIGSMTLDNHSGSIGVKQLFYQGRPVGTFMAAIDHSGTHFGTRKPHHG